MFNLLALQVFIINLLMSGKGLSGVMTNLVDNWLGPAYIILVICIAIPMIKDRQIRNLIIFLVFAAVLGVVIFFGKDLFGKEGKLTKGAKDIIDSGSTNVITLVDKDYFSSPLKYLK